jgi:hypothetical protein
MSCFCAQALQPLRLALPSLNVSLTAELPGAALALTLSDWLGARALPALPWAPDPDWLALLLPKLALNAGGMATISALAQLRAQLLATTGIDLLLPGQQAAFARLVATLSARLSVMENINPLAWLRLAGLNGAIEQVQLALTAGLLAPNASLSLALTMPGGIAMASWRALLAALVGLAPLLAACAQLGIDVSGNFVAELAASLRVLRGITLPALPAAQLSLMASLTAGLSAVARLQASLGINPLQLGFPAVEAMVAARLNLLLPALADSLRLNLNSPNLLAELLALLPALPYCPTSLATSAVIQAALSINAQAVAALNWRVPDASSLIAVRIGLPAVAFAAQLQAGLGINAALGAPCGRGCDAAAVMAML